MLSFAIVCLVIALIAAALGLGGVASVAINFAYIFGAIALILFIVHFVTGRGKTV